MRLRPAVAADAELLLRWQRQPGIRRYFRNPQPPTEAEHRQWMAAVLSDCKRHLLIIELDGAPAGMVRLDDHGDGSGEVSILVASACQGKGIGRIALGKLRSLRSDLLLLADVNPDNIPSRRIFEAAGYSWTGERFENAPTSKAE